MFEILDFGFEIQQAIEHLENVKGGNRSIRRLCDLIFNSQKDDQFDLRNLKFN